MSDNNICRVEYNRANFTPFYILANARRIASEEYRHAQNWALAEQVFAVGSTTARAICKEAGIDPDDIVVRLAAPSIQDTERKS